MIGMLRDDEMSLNVTSQFFATELLKPGQVREEIEEEGHKVLMKGEQLLCCI